MGSDDWNALWTKEKNSNHYQETYQIKHFTIYEISGMNMSNHMTLH